MLNEMFKGSQLQYDADEVSRILPPLHSTQRPGDEAVYFPSKVCSWYDPLTSTPYKTGVVDEVNVFTT